MAEAPDDLVVALFGNTVAGQDQYEIVRNFEALDMELHTASRYVGDNAVARR